MFRCWFHWRVVGASLDAEDPRDGDGEATTRPVNLQTWAHQSTLYPKSRWTASSISIISLTPNPGGLFSWHTSLFVNFFGVSFVVVVFLPVWTSRSWSGDQRVMMSDNQKSPSRRNVDKMTIWHHSPSLWAWMNQKRRWLRCILKLENMEGWSNGCQRAIKSLYSPQCHTCSEIHLYI